MRLLAPGWAGDGAISAQPSAGSTPPPGTHPLLHVGALLQHRRLVPEDVGLAVLPDLAPRLVGEEADEAEQEDDEEAADDGHGLEEREGGREEGEGEALGSPRPGRAGVWLPNPSLRLNGERSPPLPNTPSFGWAVGQPLPGAQWALESFWPSPSSGRGFGFLVGTGQAQLSGSCPPPSTWGPESRDPARGGAAAPAFPRARSPQLHGIWG